MPKKIASFALSDEAIEKMDNASKALGMSKSEYVDMMLKKGFHFSEEIQEISRLQEKVKQKIGETISDEKPT
jgi:hypothetical protein